MKTVQATQAKNLLGQVLDDACTDLVMLERHGKRQVALMPAEEAQMGVLSSYAIGVMPRSIAMKRLGFTWYGQLQDAMRLSGLSVQISADRQQGMGEEIERVLVGR